MATNPSLRRRLRIKPGEIWWASGSVQFAVLDAAVSAGSAPLSPTMKHTYHDLCSKAQSILSGPLSERTCLSRDERLFNTRPCLVHQVQDDIAECFVLTTYSGTPINQLPELMQHFSVSVGDTAPWPSPDATVIRPSPDWPKSRKTPAYVVAHTIDIPLSCFVAPYKVGDPKVDARTANAIGERKTHRKRCFVDPEQMMLLEFVARQKEKSYKGMNFQDAIKWNDSWEVNARDRQRSSPARVQAEKKANLSVEQGRVQVKDPPVHVDIAQSVNGPLVYATEENWPQRPPPTNVPFERADGGLISPHVLEPPIPRAQSMFPPPPGALPCSPDMSHSALSPPIQFQADWGQQLSPPHGIPLQERLPLFPQQMLLVPGRPDHFELGQSVDPLAHPSSGFPLPPAQSWAPVIHQPPVLFPPGPPQFATAMTAPPPDSSVQYSYIPAAPTAPPTAECFEHQAQYHGPATTHAPSTFQHTTDIQHAHSDYQQNAGTPGYYNQYPAHFHPSAFGMHQAEHMYVVTQENEVYMPPQMMTRAHSVLMHAPEMVDVAAG